MAVKFTLMCLAVWYPGHIMSDIGHFLLIGQKVEQSDKKSVKSDFEMK